MELVKIGQKTNDPNFTNTEIILTIAYQEMNISRNFLEFLNFRLFGVQTTTGIIYSRLII